MKYINLILVFYLGIYFLTILHADEECAVGSEGSSIRLLCTVTSKVKRVITWQVERDGQYVNMTTCYIKGLCFTKSPDFYAFMTGTNCTIHIKSLNRSLHSWRCVWDDVHAGQPCNVTVYVAPHRPKCEKPQFINSNTALSVTCLTDKTFPQATCLFSQYTNVSILNNTRVIYVHQPSAFSSQDISTQCTFVGDLQPLTQPMTLTLGFEMMSQPNSPASRALNISIDLYYPEPVLGLDCPKDFIASGTPATCTCNLADKGSPPGQANWHYVSAERLVTSSKVNGASQLDISYNVSEVNPRYVCYTTSAIGRNTRTLAYEPKIAQGPFQIFLKALPRANVQLTKDTAVQLRCNVYRDQVHPGVIFSFHINDQHFPVWPHNADKTFYTSTYTLAPDVTGTYNVTCVARNSKISSITAKRSLMIYVFGNQVKLQLDIQGPHQTDLCSRTMFPVTCKVKVLKSYQMTTTVLYINNQVYQTKTSLPTNVHHVLTYNLLPSTLGKFEVRCVVMTNQTLLAEDIQVITVYGGVCGVSSIALGLAVGLGCIVLLTIAITIIVIVVWRRRHNLDKSLNSKNVYFTAFNNSINVIALGKSMGNVGSMPEPPPDYLPDEDLMEPIYLPRVSPTSLQMSQQMMSVSMTDKMATFVGLPSHV